jgi:hypothetical protein
MIRNRCSRTQNGITLIELIIAIAGGLIIFGLVLAILIRTSAATDADIHKATMQQEARLIANTIVKALKQFCPESELGQAGPTPVTHFAENQMQFLSLHGAKENQPLLLLIANGRDPKTNLKRVIMRRTVLGQKPLSGSAEREPGVQTLGIGTGDVESEVQLRYAGSFEMLAPQWVASLEAGAIPRVVEITIITRDAAQRLQPVTITTSLALPSSEERL